MKPTLALLSGKDALDVDALARLFTALTGRDPTPEEIAQARAKIAAHNAKADEPRDWFPVLVALAEYDATGETRALADALDGATPDAIPERVRLVIADTFIRRAQRKPGRPAAILRDHPALRAAVVVAFAEERAKLAEAAAERKAQKLPPAGDAEGRTLREAAADAVRKRKPFHYLADTLKRSAILRAVAAAASKSPAKPRNKGG